jgi:pimeloyl-ACP methyl ester carboxylesterase
MPKPRIARPEKLLQKEDVTPPTLHELAWTLEGKAQHAETSFAESITLKRLSDQLFAGDTDSPELKNRPDIQAMVTKLEQMRMRREVEYEKGTPLTVQPGFEVPLHRIEGKDSESPGEGTKLLIAPGCFNGPLQLRDFAVASAAYGGGVIAPEMLTPEQGRSAHIENSKDMTDVVSAYRHTLEATMRAVAQGNEHEQVDLLGFSTGAAAVVDAALRNPEKIRQVILVNPIGLNSPESGYLTRMKSTLTGTVAHMKQITDNGLIKSPKYQQFASGMPRQAWRGYGEVVEIIHASAKLNLTPLIAELKAKGVEVTIVMSENDQQFNASDVGESVAKAPGCGFLVVTGGHTKIGADPQQLAALVADVRSGVMR